MKSNAILNWINSAMRSNAVIYWACAFYSMCAMQWHPLWALAPFIAGALLRRSFRNRKSAATLSRLPEKTNVEPVLASQIPEVIPGPARPTVIAQKLVTDPFMKTPRVFEDEKDWSQFNSPAYQRKGIDIAALIKAPLVARPADQFVPEPLFIEIPELEDHVQNTHTDDAGGAFAY